jgi:hypothetical protein
MMTKEKLKEIREHVYDTLYAIRHNQWSTAIGFCETALKKIDMELNKKKTRRKK